MKKIILFFVLCSASPSLLEGQQALQPNEFKIGMFGASFKEQTISGCSVPYTTPIVAGNKTSTLNVFAEDGFNINQTYEPNEWSSESSLKNRIILTGANGMKVEVGAGHFYKPSVDMSGNYLGYGTNVYDNCGSPIGVCATPFSQNYFRPNINNCINNIFKIAPYKDLIWGYHLSEEASYYHFCQFTNNCVGNIWGDPAYFKNVEIPPANINSAISHYKSSLATAGILNHKMVVMEANHGKSVNAGTIDQHGVYNPQQYLQLLNKYDNRDVYFEGSYSQFPTGWVNTNYSDISNTGPGNNWHYLGSFKSIEYAKGYSGSVHKVICIGGTGGPDGDPNYMAHFHSDMAVPNGNWLWFQAYNSIIHGAEGVWFWDFNYAWNIGETNNFGNTAIANRFDRSYFPSNYQLYAGYLAKEIRLLVDKNIISTDNNTVVATKTDLPDPYCILPAASTYIPTYLPAEKKTENYGLRYTIRSSGTETYMIITNPLNVAVSTTLNFSGSANSFIQNSTGVNVLFDNNANAVTSSSYKVNRNSSINLPAGTVANQYFIAYSSGKQLALSMGPMDVKILKFVSAPPNHNNGWNLSWSNFGSGNINGWTVGDNDLFYAGDFDGDATQELLCVQYNPASSTDWISLLKFVNGNWEWVWSNNGSATAGNGIYAYRGNFVVGDYNGDGTDELLGNNPTGLTTLFEFSGGNWQWKWSDNSAHAIRPYKDKFYSGDFYGGRADELFGCDLPSGGTIIFEWNGSDFVAGWTDNGAHGISPYRHNLLVGNYDTDLKDEIVGFDRWATLFDFSGGTWNWIWSTNNANHFNGWAYPLPATDKVLAGNIDNDGREELLFIQTNTTASWATSMDLKSDLSGWNWNWSGNNSYSVPFVDDWPLAAGAGTNTKYSLISPTGISEHLLCMRKFCNSYLVSMYQPDGNNKSAIANADNVTEESTGKIEVFPNPSAGKVLVTSEQTGICRIEIYNGKGQIISKDNYNSVLNIEVDLSNQPNGIYLIKMINSEGRISNHKIILNK